MKKNKSTLIDDEIDIRNFIQNLWKNKILIFSISILLMLLGYISSSNVNVNNRDYYKWTIGIKKIPKEVFDPYQKMYDYSSQKLNNYVFFQEFNEMFIKNLTDLDNIVSFLEENKGFDNLKIFLKSKEITAANYFYDNNFGLENNSGINNIFFFTILPINTDADKFLNSYITFVFDKTKIQIKNLANSQIKQILVENEDALNRIKIFKSINSTNLSDLSKNYLVPEDELLKRISFLKEIESLIYNFQINLNLKSFLVKTQLSSQVSNYNPQITNALLGLILGFFLSLIIIFFRNNL